MQTQDTPCLTYDRFSTDKQDNQRQLAALRAYCARHSLHVVTSLSDPDTSGGIPMHRRAGGSRLLECLRALPRNGPPPAFVTTELERVGRDTIDAVTTVRLIWNLGIIPHFTSEGAGPFPRSDQNEMILEVTASIAQFTKNRIISHIKGKLAAKRAAGELTGSLTYGWAARYTWADGHTRLATTRALTAAEKLAAEQTHGPLRSSLIEPYAPEQQHLLELWRHRWGWQPLAKIAAWLEAGRRRKTQVPSSNSPFPIPRDSRPAAEDSGLAAPLATYHQLATWLNAAGVPAKIPAGTPITVTVGGRREFGRLVGGEAVRKSASGLWQHGNVQKLLESRLVLAHAEQQSWSP